MAIALDDIRGLIRAALPDAEVRVEDTTGGGDHFAATVVSAAFAGKGPVDRHRLVYAALGDAMRGPIHALALVTETPDEHRSRTTR
ncbi:MAG TPA: BolA family protein [Polyangia bacterium]|nr:BolA family protein [Polyangia bacterium]